ncbi:MULTISPECIES: acyl-CoA dehydrogenase family protein [Cupriavidus]
MIPRTLFEADHEAYRDSVRRFVAGELAPRHAHWEREGIVPRGIWRQAGAAGLLCCGVAERYGGPEASFLFNVVVIEELARAGITAPGFFIHSEMVAPYLEVYASEALKSRWLPRMVRGEAIGAIGITEPGAGSDVRGIAATARRDGGEYVINGQKTFISNAHNCDFVVLVVKSGPPGERGAMSLILVESDRAGFSRGPRMQKLGNRGQDTAELFFDDVRVPASNLIGAEHRAMAYLTNNLARERLAQAVRAAAVCEATLEQTVAHVKARMAFGQPLAAFQNTRFKLAELRAAITAARVYVDRCIELQLRGTLDAADAAALKLQLVELQCATVDQCLQLHGGSGYLWDSPVCRAYADARIAKIAGGSLEIMKQIIARDLIDPPGGRD